MSITKEHTGACVAEQTSDSIPTLIAQAFGALARADVLNADTQWDAITEAMGDFHELVEVIAQHTPETTADAMAQIGFFIAELERADIADMSESVTKLLEAAKRAAEWLSAQQSAAGDDPFADGLAALDAEARIPLDMPQQPSDAVLAAGAAAAGITTERFAAGLAAAVQAYQMESAE